ncbi:MAG: hypothetical protein H7Z39_09340, partial [Burkholderiaceae bacterium]|nr:hypothetical protein [Burkholderiaceae bacterium]
MKRRIWHFLCEPRNLAILGLAALLAVFYVGAELLELAALWALAGFAAVLAALPLAWWWRRRRARRAAGLLEQGIAGADGAAAPGGSDRDELKLIRKSLLAA